MKKFIFIISLILSYVCPLQAQLTMEQFFVQQLRQQLQINTETRTALLEKYTSGKGNTLTLKGGATVSVLDYEENSYLKIQTSKQGTFTLKRWSSGKGNYFAMCWNICAPLCDAVIKVVREDTATKPYKYYNVPIPENKITDFVIADSLKEDGLTPEDFANKLEMELINYQLPNGDKFIVSNNTPQFLDEQRAKKYKKYWKKNDIIILFVDGEFLSNIPQN